MDRKKNNSVASHGPSQAYRADKILNVKQIFNKYLRIEACFEIDSQYWLHVPHSKLPELELKSHKN